MAEIVEKRIIPTVPMRVVAKTYIELAAGSRTALGSVIIPTDKQGQLTVLKFAASTPDVWLQISGQIGTVMGTVDFTYLEASGEHMETGNIYEPLTSFEAGTVILSALSMAAKGSAHYMVKARIDLV